LLALCILATSCGSYRSARNQGRSRLAFRAFVSNPLSVTQLGTGSPALNIVDASKDVLSLFSVSLLATVPDAGQMALSPNKARTLVFSPSNNQFAVVDNITETPLSGVSAIGLPGSTESFFISSDNKTAYAAVPGAVVSGQPSGVVEQIDISRGGITATIPIPGAHYLSAAPSGNQILVFSDNSNLVTLLTPSLLANGNSSNLQGPCTSTTTVACTIAGFDRPVTGIFNTGGTAAYVLNCGPECGGVASSAALLDLSQSPPAVINSVALPAATAGLLNGSTLYVAGTPASPLDDCAGVTTAAPSCGRLSIIDVAGFTVTNTAPLVITDGRHDRMQMGANGKLFIGATKCSNVNNSGGEIRGCLTIADTLTGGSAPNIVTPPQIGDVTGIEPVPHRSVVYVCEGGGMQIYDTATDKAQTTQVSIVGQAIDVKIVDF
jgi:hypothetical protein